MLMGPVLNTVVTVVVTVMLEEKAGEAVRNDRQAGVDARVSSAASMDTSLATVPARSP